MTGAVILAAAAACHPVAGSHITGADLRAASAVFRDLAPEVVIGYAPRPGARRFFRTGELAGIARAHGLEGAGVEPLCFERATAPLDQGRVREAMLRALGLPDAQIEIVELSRLPAPEGEIVFPRASLAEPGPPEGLAAWNGYVQYAGGRFPIWARVRIAARQQRVVAAVELKPGRAIKPGEVKVEDGLFFPSRTPALADAGEAVGRTVRRYLRAGMPIESDALEAPYAVAKGDSVSVEVRSGGAVLTFIGAAETPGRRGDMIPVRNPSSGKTFRARVEAKNSVVVEALR